MSRFEYLKTKYEGKTIVVDAVILNEENQILIQKRSATRKLFPNSWEFVGGHLEENEGIEDCLKRELQEETKMNFVMILEHLNTFYWGENTVNLQMLVRATGQFVGEETKIIEHRFVDTDFEEELDTNIRQTLNLAIFARKKYLTHPNYYDLDFGSKLQIVANKKLQQFDMGGDYIQVGLDFAKLQGSKYGILANSGTGAFHACLIALDLPVGSEVIVPAMTFVRAVSPLTHMRLIPVLADINPEFGTITLEGIEQVFSNKTKAVLIVHMWGVPVDMDPIINFCKEKGILIIEDFSHAHFSEYKDQKTGTFGDISFASIQRKKLISVGEGGIITTNSLDYFEKLKNIVSPGSFEKDMAGYGLNFRMNHFGVGALQYLLPKISSIVQERFELVKIFKSIANEYPNIISLPKIPEYATFISHYSIKVKVVDFEKLNQLPFKVKDFGYDFITNSIFWDKQSSNNFLQDTHKPKSLEHYPNTIKYLENNRTLDF